MGIWYLRLYAIIIKIINWTIIRGPPYNFFFGNADKTLLNIFFYLKAQSCRLIMENNVIETTALADCTVAYPFDIIFNHFIHSFQLYFTNGFPNIIFCCANCPRHITYLWRHLTYNSDLRMSGTCLRHVEIKRSQYPPLFVNKN